MKGLGILTNLNVTIHLDTCSLIFDAGFMEIISNCFFLKSFFLSSREFLECSVCPMRFVFTHVQMDGAILKRKTWETLEDTNDDVSHFTTGNTGRHANFTLVNTLLLTMNTLQLPGFFSGAKNVSH